MGMGRGRAMSTGRDGVPPGRPILLVSRPRRAALCVVCQPSNRYRRAAMGRTRLLDHEKLEIYQRARQFNRGVYALLSRARTNRRDLIDQLQRAAASMLLNLAEGAGEHAKKEKARFYRMSRRSATESAGVLDLLVDTRSLPSGRRSRCSRKLRSSSPCSSASRAMPRHPPAHCPAPEAPRPLPCVPTHPPLPAERSNALPPPKPGHAPALPPSPSPGP